MYVDPITGKDCYLLNGVPLHEEHHEEYKNVIRRSIIFHVIDDLKYRQLNNFYFYLKYRELTSKQKELIKAIQAAHSNNFPQLYTFVNLPEFCDFVYQNIYPHLGMFPVQTDIYKRLLQFVDNQCIEYSCKSLKMEQNIESVKS
jgi:hypothetical protein